MWRPLVLIALALGASPATAQVITDMTPQRIKEAIALGESGKAKPYKIGGSTLTPLWGTFSTPYLRVALAAAEAKEKYSSFTEKDATDEIVRPGEVIVYLSAIEPLSGNQPRSAKAIVIMPAGKNDRADAVRPEKTEPTPASWSNAMGAKWEAESLIAYFPLSALQDGAEFRMVFDRGLERKAGIKLDKVR
jgi:hypothetical protein